MKIEIDTEKDSKESIEKAVLLLKEIISMKGLIGSVEMDVAQILPKPANDEIIPPSKEEILAYKKGRNGAFSESKKEDKDDSRNREESHIEIY